MSDTWMCDHGRLSYKLNGTGRLVHARVGGDEATYPEAVKRAGELVRAALDAKAKIVGVASPFASNEDLAAFRDLLAKLGAGPARFSVPRGEADEVLIEAEKAANAAGCRALGMVETNDPVARSELAIALGHTTTAEVFGDVANVVLLDSHESALSARAAVTLPVRTYLEKSGTFTNSRGLEQAFRAVVEPTFEAWTEKEALAQIAAAAGLE